MDLATGSLGGIVAKPVLQEGRGEGGRAQGVEAITLAGMDHSQLARESQDRALGSRESELRSSRPDESDHGGRVDYGALRLAVAAHGEHGMLASIPHTLHVDVLRQIPYLLGC